MTTELFDLSKRIYVITGGLGQLGKQFTLTLLDMGAKVAIFDLPPKLEIHNRFWKEEHTDSCKYFSVDVCDKKAIEKALQKITDHWGTPHGLINNAALDSPPNAPPEGNGPFETYPEESWDEVMKVNTKGIFLMCQIFGKVMTSKQRGVIINICSTYGLVSPDQRIYEYRQASGDAFFKPPAYTASKASILGLTKYLATYFAPSGIRVNSLTPHGIFNNQDANFLKEFKRRVPLGRMAKENEYNGAIVFLLSDASSYMTGSNLVIDGGWTAW